MKHYARFCVAISLLLLLACGGGGGGDSPPPSANISVQSTVDFGGIVLNNAEERLVEVTNTGSLDLVIGQLAPLSAPYQIVANADGCSNTTIAPNHRCSLRVRFLPTAQNAYSATLSIPSNDPDAGVRTVGLTGEGYGLNVWINKVDLANCPSAISVDVMVTEASGNPLTALTADAFTLHQNNIRIPAFNAFVQQALSPASVVLTLDSSGSMSSISPAIQAAAAGSFIGQLSDNNYAAICKIGNDTSVIQFYPPLSLQQTNAAGRDDLINNGIYSTFNPTATTTALFDSLMLAVDRAALQNVIYPDKRVLIIVSDGVDNSPTTTHTLEQVIAYARQMRVKIFSVYYISPNLAQYARPEVMTRLAGETGGLYFDATDEDFAGAFTKIRNIVTNNYTITYTSTTCSGTVSVRTDSAGLYGADTATFP